MSAAPPYDESAPPCASAGDRQSRCAHIRDLAGRASTTQIADAISDALQASLLRHTYSRTAVHFRHSKSVN